MIIVVFFGRGEGGVCTYETSFFPSDHEYFDSFTTRLDGTTGSADDTSFGFGIGATSPICARSLPWSCQ